MYFSDLVDHDLKMILGMIWSIILDYQIKGISVEELSAKEGLLLWCQKKTQGYKDVKVDNFHTSFQDGLAFCALIHKHRPDLLDFDSLDKENKAHNLQLAFDVAEKLGIPKLLDVEDIVDVARPDERSIMTYVSEYFHYFASQNQQEIAGRRIAKVVNLTKLNDQLRASYTASASALLNWIRATIGRLEGDVFDNTLENVQQKISSFEDYKQVEKPPKTKEKFDVETIYNNLSLKLRANNRPAFVPAEGHSITDIDAAWKALEAAELAYSAKLLSELARQEKLEALANRFHNKANLLGQFTAGKKNLLDSANKNFSTVGQVQVSLQLLDAFDSDLDGAKPRLQAVEQLGAEIVADHFRDSASVSSKVEELKGKFGDLHNASGARRQELEAELKKQQHQEELRKEFAKLAREFERYLKDNSENARDFTSFGDTLEDVEAYSAKLAEETSSTLAAADQKRGGVEKVDADLKATGASDNRYTHLTVNDLVARQNNLKELFEQRKAAYDQELAKQRQMEQKRIEFAQAAQAFVDYLSAERAKISALEGEPEDQINAIKSIDGANDGENRLGALKALDNENRNSGIVYNRHTNLSVVTLEARLNAYRSFVKNALEDLEQSLVLKQKAAEATKEWEQQQKLEDLKIEFAKKAGALNVYLENANDVLTEPIAVNTIEAVDELVAAFEGVNAEYAPRQSEKDALVAFNQQLVDVGITENPNSEITADEASSRFANIGELLNSRKSTLDAEKSKQANNESLRVEFASAASAASAFIDSNLAKLQASEGPVEEQLSSLDAQKIERSLVDNAKVISDKLREAGVRSNKHTNLSLEDLEAKWNSLHTAAGEKRKLLESELLAKQHGQVPPEQLKEINECFAQFDKDNSGFLSPHEFKACLSALGEAISEENLHVVTKAYGDADGRVSKEKFTDFMIARLSDTDTADQIVNSFKTLAGNQDFVTEQQLRAAFGGDPDALQYLLANLPPKDGIAGGYDFTKFVHDAFSR